MASLDFVYDLVEKFDEEKINYLVVSLRAGKAEDKVDVFFNVEPENEPTFSVAIDQVKEILEANKGKNAINKKPKRKRKKKGE